MTKVDPIHTYWMRRAIDLAKLGNGLTSPNPLVGAVLLNADGDLVSEGFHHRSGMPHAEAMAFDNLSQSVTGGSIYINLEPCCHQGKTPPCTERIISSGLKKVFIGMEDPDIRVSGQGIKALKNAGLDVNIGLCEEEALELNKFFIHRNQTGCAYGVLKWAMSIDGRIGLKNGKSKWISNDISRKFVHTMRAQFDAIIVGGNTVRNDNPILTSRGIKNPEPLRVVFSKSLKFPQKYNIFNCQTAKTLLVYDSTSVKEEFLKLIPSWVDVEKLPSDNPRFLSKLLAERGCNKVLWECGPNLATSAIKNGCIQEISTFIAPKILGGVNSMNPLSDFNFEEMNQVIRLKKSKLNVFEDDIYLNFFSE